jgi:hypothetical protein
MIWYLLLAFPAIVVVMGAAARFGTVTATDTACAVADLRLDRQADLARADAATQRAGVPQPRRASRVAARPVPALHPELLAG